MMRREVAWGRLLGAFVLIGGGLLASAEAAPPAKETSSGTHTQNWDRSFPASTRFTVLTEFQSQAVRDNNTGLVWEQAPDQTTRTWAAAVTHCAFNRTGGTKGWRLPTLVELESVQDATTIAPYVPTSVFTIPITPFVDYWSSTDFVDLPGMAYVVEFSGNQGPTINKTIPLHVWCVRGPMKADVY